MRYGCRFFFRNFLVVSELIFIFAVDMKKEFGKWLMDISKYMVTALLLATIFADMEEPIIVYAVVILSVIVLGFGLYWVNEGEKEEKRALNKKKK